MAGLLCSGALGVQHQVFPKWFVALMDGFSAVCLAVYALLLGPLGILRGPLLAERAFVYARVLAPRGLLSRFVRAAIDWRMGNFDAAISESDAIVSNLEAFYESSSRRSCRRVLEDLYALMARAYLHVGRMDDAMMTVLRAKRSIGVERLPGLSELNAKTAHLIRAGLSAGRLLDGGGLATLFVKAPPPPPSPTGRGSRQGATAHNSERPMAARLRGDNKGKVLLFPIQPNPSAGEDGHRPER